MTAESRNLNDLIAAQLKIEELEEQITALHSIGQPAMPAPDRVDLESRIASLHNVIKTLQAKIRGLEFESKPIGQSTAPTEFEQSTFRIQQKAIWERDRTIKKLQVTVQRGEAGIKSVIADRSRFVNERDTAFEKISELQTEAGDYRRGIRYKDFKVAELSCINKGLAATIENKVNAIKGLIADRTIDKAGYEDLFIGFRKKVKQLMDENVNLQTKLAGANNEISQLRYRQEPNPVKAELDSEYIKSLERKNGSLLESNRVLVEKLKFEEATLGSFATTLHDVSVGNKRLSESNKTLVARIESLKADIKDAIRTLKRGYAFGATPLRLIKFLESAL